MSEHRPDPVSPEGVYLANDFGERFRDSHGVGCVHLSGFLVVGCVHLAEIFPVQYPLTDAGSDQLNLLDAKRVSGPEILYALVCKTLDIQRLERLTVAVDLGDVCFHA